MRVLAATNRNLETAVAEGRFRQDLYYRLSVFTIALPPLRERGDDLPLLVNHYVRRYSRELGKDVQSVAPEAMELLRRYAWPGNVRELQSVLQAGLAARGRAGPAAGVSAAGCRPPGAGARRRQGAGLERFIDARWRRGRRICTPRRCGCWSGLLLPRVLRHTGGNQLRAAKILGITRGSLRTKLRELGIRIDRNTDQISTDKTEP